MSQQATVVTTAPEPKLWAGGRSPYNVSYGKMMMWFFLLSDALTFGALLISYGTTRFFSTVWPDANQVFKSFPFMGEHNLPLLFVSLMTFILIMSSVTMVLAVHAGHYNDKKNVAKWLLWTIVGGICSTNRFSLVEDIGLHNQANAAHELGHKYFVGIYICNNINPLFY